MTDTNTGNENGDKYQVSEVGQKALNGIITYTEYDQEDGTWATIDAKVQMIEKGIAAIEGLRADYTPLTEDDELLLGILKTTKSHMIDLSGEIYDAFETYRELLSTLKGISESGLFDANDIDKVECRM